MSDNILFNNMCKNLKKIDRTLTVGYSKHYGTAKEKAFLLTRK